MEVERNKQRRPVQIWLTAPGGPSAADQPVRRTEPARPATASGTTGSVSGGRNLASAPARPASSSGSEGTDLKPGMTQAQVTRALGEPAKKVSFGAKTIWTYDGFTVTFVDGKVTDVK
jgi:hypothetical protein